jgi:excisionase family DNA binding protein
MVEEWITVKDAAKLRKCSERNIIELIHKEELEAKKDGRRWLILMDTSEATSAESPQSEEITSLLKAQLEEKDSQIRQSQEQVAEKDKQIERLQSQIDEKDNQMERLHQLLAIEKTQTQQLLEHQLLPFWRRWRRKQLPGPTDTAE